MKPRIVAILISVCLLGPSAPSAQGYGRDGHRIICAIAYGLLAPEYRAEVDRLVRLYRTPDNGTIGDFPTACTFADSARGNARDERPGWTRFNPFNNWHFMNLPRNVRQIRESGCGRDCVLGAIEYHRLRLENAGLGAGERAEALFFMAHWVGDVHQPLHVSYEDDLGGNRTGPIVGDYYESSNMHAVWDSGIVSKALAGTRWPSYARGLARRILPAESETWVRTGPLEWAQESYDITTSQEFEYCEWSNGRCRPIGGARALGSSYQNEFQGVVEQRLKKAGVRLSDLIERALGR
jgi:hypothetical protein